MVVESKGKGGRKGGKGSGKGAGAGSGSSRPRKQARLTDTGRGGKNKGGARAPNGGAGKYKKRGKFSKGSGRPSKKPALTKEQKKELKRLRKAGKHGELLTKAKQLWYTIRTKTSSSADRKEAVASLLVLLKGKMLDVVLRHDASRIVQVIIQFGNEEQQGKVLQELKGHWVNFCKSRHGHFVARKAFRYCTEEARLEIAKELEGNIVRLATQNFGVLVLEEALCGHNPLPKAAAWRLQQELYATEFKTFKCKHASLAEAFVAEPTKQRGMLEHMLVVLRKQIDKELLGLTFVQELVWQYFSHAEPIKIADMVPFVVEASLAMLSSEPGAKAMCMAIGMATAKQRKAVAKSLREHVAEVAMHETGHMKLTKGVIAELVPDLVSVACDQYGRKVLLHLLTPGHRRYFKAADRVLLQSLQRPKLLDDGTVEMLPSTKKPLAVKCKELLSAVAEPLEEMALVDTRQLVCSYPGGDVLVEAYRALELESVADAVVEQVRENLDFSLGATTSAAADAEEKPFNVLDSAPAHRVLRSMLGAQPHIVVDEDAQASMTTSPLAQSFASKLAAVFAGKLLAVATSCNRGAFTVLHLLLALPDDEKTTAKAELLAGKDELTAQAESRAGAKVLLEAIGVSKGDAAASHGSAGAGRGSDEAGADASGDVDEDGDVNMMTPPVAARTRSRKSTVKQSRRARRTPAATKATPAPRRSTRKRTRTNSQL